MSATAVLEAPQVNPGTQVQSVQAQNNGVHNGATTGEGETENHVASPAPKVNRAACVRKAVNEGKVDLNDTKAIKLWCKDHLGVEVSSTDVANTRKYMTEAKKNPESPPKKRGRPSKNGSPDAKKANATDAHDAHDGRVGSEDTPMQKENLLTECAPIKSPQEIFRNVILSLGIKKAETIFAAICRIMECEAKRILGSDHE